MAVRDWPASLVGAELQFYLRKSGVQFRGLTDGDLQAWDWLSERWVCSVTLPTYRRGTDAERAAAAMANWLPGGVNRVRVHNQARPVPAGLMRGHPSCALASDATKGTAALAIVGARAGQNLAPNPGFLRQQTVGSEQLPAGWYEYNNNQATAGASFSMSVGGPRGADSKFVRVQADDPQVIGGYGIYRTVNDASLWVAHLPHVISFWARAAGAALEGWQALGVYNNMGWESSSILEIPGLINGTWQRYSALVVPPANATTPLGELYLSLYDPVGGRTMPAGAQWDIADVQVTLGSQLKPWAGVPSAKAGDFVGCGGQLFQVLEDASIASDGVLTVQTVNKVRKTIAAGTPVVLERPTIECILPAMAAPATERGRAYTPAMFDLEEA